jgi:four helix bundle protein
MKYTHFEELPVWQTAMDLAEKVFRMTADKCFTHQGDLANQMQRASLSVSNNVAEGFERGTTNELLTFLYIARGSAGEVRSMTYLCDRLAPFAHLKSQISDLRSLAESISRQLRAWADHLQNSPIAGQRYLTDAVRSQDERKKRLNAFDAQLERVRQEAASRKPGAGGSSDGPQSGEAHHPAEGTQSAAYRCPPTD